MHAGGPLTTSLTPWILIYAITQACAHLYLASKPLNYYVESIRENPLSAIPAPRPTSKTLWFSKVKIILMKILCIH